MPAQWRIPDELCEAVVVGGKANGERPVIGVNKYVCDDESPNVETHAVDPQTERRQIECLKKVKAERDNQKAAAALDELKAVAADEAANIMPATIAAVQARASMGEIVETLRTLWGTYRETPVI